MSLAVFLAVGPAGLSHAQTEEKTSEEQEKSAEIPVPQKSLIQTTRTSRYSVPLSFDPSESGILFPPPEIDYDLTQDSGQTLRIGNLLLNGKTFSVVLSTLGEVQPDLRSLSGVDTTKSVMIFRWPQQLLVEGQIEILSRTGRLLWQKKISENEITEWRNKTVDWAKSLKARGVPPARLQKGIFDSQLGLDLSIFGPNPSWARNEFFRVCLTRTEISGNSRLCSARMTGFERGGKVLMKKAPITVNPRVVVLNRSGDLKGTVVIPDGSGPAQFFAELADGSSYEFVSQTPTLNIVDLADTVKPGILRVSGFGTRPLSYNIILNPDNYGQLTKLLGFEPTIGDKRKFWAAALKVDDSKMFFPGPGGGVFQQRFELNAIPRASGRLHLDSRSPKGSYAKSLSLFGRKQPNSKVTSEQNYARELSGKPDFFNWEFRSEEEGETNRSYIAVEYEGKTYKSFYEVYRSYANELSGRLSGIAAAGGALIVADISYNHWFENFFGWDQYFLASQRWGASARYFKSLTKLNAKKTNGDTEPVGLDVMTFDLKYRFSPGLWTRDETVGAILGYQNVTFGPIKAPMLGVGGFWARSMPRSLDEIFNYFPFMNYPKWVDVEFIYFMKSMSDQVTISNTMALNFHGQVLWKKNFFGEAGFGYKLYGMVDNSIPQEATLATFYATAGLGLKF